jgi:hypothetical protein
MSSIPIASQKPRPRILIVSLAALLVVVLAACGTNGKAGSGTGSGSTPTPTPTTIPGYGAVNGCPSDAVVTSAPPVPNVTVKLTDANSTVTAHVGDVIEIQLPFGQKWTGPAFTGGELQLQTPAGYASTATKMCIWRLSSQSAGMTHLTYSVGVICKKGLPCPRYMSDVTFTIVVK